MRLTSRPDPEACPELDTNYETLHTIFGRTEIDLADTVFTAVNGALTLQFGPTALLPDPAFLPIGWEFTGEYI